MQKITCFLRDLEIYYQGTVVAMYPSDTDFAI